MNRRERYIYDALYGPIDLPEAAWEVFTCPELQRLREVRLCNTNSLSIPGGSNISRFEHAIGTCFLAKKCLENWPPLLSISEKEQKYLVWAALLHDVTSASFGHSMEYVISGEGFNHEKAFRHAVLGRTDTEFEYVSATFQPIFFGMPFELPSILTEKEVESISEIIEGKGRLGPLLNRTMDLDNIDNVYRLAYHIGLTREGKEPIKLAEAIYVKDGNIVVRDEGIPFVEKWHQLRKRLYSLLLWNADEFSSKCMLEDALELARRSSLVPFNWFDVDYEMLSKLRDLKSYSNKTTKGESILVAAADISDIVSRLMSGKLYGCIGIYATSKADKYQHISDSETREKWKQDISEMIRGYIFSIPLEFQDTPITEEEKRVVKETFGRNQVMLSEDWEITQKGPHQWRVKDGKKKYILRMRGQELRTYAPSKFGSEFQSAMVSIHMIKDINKTERKVHFLSETESNLSVGNSSNRILIGVFLSNKNLNMQAFDTKRDKRLPHIQVVIGEYIGEQLDDPDIRIEEIYGEIDDL